MVEELLGFKKKDFSDAVVFLEKEITNDSGKTVIPRVTAITAIKKTLEALLEDTIPVVEKKEHKAAVQSLTNAIKLRERQLVENELSFNKLHEVTARLSGQLAEKEIKILEMKMPTENTIEFGINKTFFARKEETNKRYAKQREFYLEKIAEKDIQIIEQEELLLDLLWQACGIDVDGGIDNRCLSCYEEVCEYLFKKGLIEKGNDRIYFFKKDDKRISFEGKIEKELVK
jgi:hypothetical protein